MTAAPSPHGEPDPIPPELLRSLAQRAGLSLTDDQISALGPAAARLWRQADHLRALPLREWEPAPVFTPRSQDPA